MMIALMHIVGKVGTDARLATHGRAALISTPAFSIFSPSRRLLEKPAQEQDPVLSNSRREEAMTPENTKRARQHLGGSRQVSRGQ